MLEHDRRQTNMIGKTISKKYKIEQAISESHCYEIYKALELKTGTKVIVKILKEEMACLSHRVKSFSEEIKAFASISHSMVAEILDMDILEDRPYVVAEMVEGSDMLSLIKGPKIPFGKAIRIASELADFLKFASTQNISCRTIKLSNVIIQKDESLKLTSFTHPRLKLASMQALSSGTHSDLFFLGTTLFELLTGESPIRRRGGINELWDMKLEQKLRIRHSELSPKQIAKVVDVVRKTLTRDVKIRFNSHDELINELVELKKITKATIKKEKSRQLYMASEVVEALNSKSSSSFQACVGANTYPTQLPETFTSSKAPADLTNAEKASLKVINGKGSKQVDSQKRTNSKSHLKVVKPKVKNGNRKHLEVWDDESESHWLKSPLIFMSLCLFVMIMLLLFW